MKHLANQQESRDIARRTAKLESSAYILPLVVGLGLYGSTFIQIFLVGSVKLFYRAMLRRA